MKHKELKGGVMSMVKWFLPIYLFTCLPFIASAQMKREMRGAWIQCVNGQFQGMGTAKMQQTLTYQLDELQKDGVNVIIFQVRPECDALYESKIEPWSRFLTYTRTGPLGVRSFSARVRLTIMRTMRLLRSVTLSEPL